MKLMKYLWKRWPDATLMTITIIVLNVFIWLLMQRIFLPPQNAEQAAMQQWLRIGFQIMGNSIIGVYTIMWFVGERVEHPKRAAINARLKQLSQVDKEPAYWGA